MSDIIQHTISLQGEILTTNDNFVDLYLAFLKDNNATMKGSISVNVDKYTEYEEIDSNNDI